MAEPRHVAEDVIFSILTKLPAKSVLRFRTVSQSWNAMIRSSAFVSAHHRHQIRNSKNCSQIYITSGQKKLTRTVSATMVRKSGTNNQSLCCRGLEDYNIVGYCEGLICLCPNFSGETYPRLSLWNPAIQIQKTIPIRNSPTNSDQVSYDYGFGFNRRSNDHTVVKIATIPLRNKEVEIYSLVKDCWRRIEVPEEMAAVYLSHQVASFKGSIYWLGLVIPMDMNMNMTVRCAILRFDVEEEIFKVVELPRIGRNSSMNIKEFNGFLLFLEVSSEDRHVSAAWILKEDWIRLNLLLLPEQDRKTKQVEALAAGSIISSAGSVGSVMGHIIGISSIMGSIILKGTEDDRLFACDGYLDGNNLSLKLEDLKINLTDQTDHYLTPVVETLILLDRTLIWQEIKGDYKRLAF